MEGFMPVLPYLRTAVWSSFKLIDYTIGISLETNRSRFPMWKLVYYSGWLRFEVMLWGNGEYRLMLGGYHVDQKIFVKAIPLEDMFLWQAMGKYRHNVNGTPK